MTTPTTTPAPTPMKTMPGTDEYGNPMPLMYCIPFEGESKAYFYTEKTYRAATARISELEAALVTARRIVNDILHQRTGITGYKVEDDLIRENEPLYRQALGFALNQPRTDA